MLQTDYEIGINQKSLYAPTIYMCKNDDILFSQIVSFE